MQTERVSIQDAVYSELKSAIMELRFPPGQSMSTQEIAMRLNVSRTPVREAFLRLERDGLVISIPQRATIVSKIDFGRLDQERFIRSCLEVSVAKDYIEHSTEGTNRELRELIERQRKALQEKNQNDFLKFDNEFHEKIFATADRALAWQTIQNTSGHYNRFRLLIVQAEDIASKNIEEHESIVDAFEAKDLARARQLTEEHLKRKPSFDREELVRLYSDYVYDSRLETGRAIVNKL